MEFHVQPLASALSTGKKFAVLCALLTQSATAYTEPAKGSPAASVSQSIDDAVISVEYSRPGVRGRVIWGQLVPYDEVWRAGANDKTSIEFSDDVVIEGKKIPAGIYSLFILVTEDDWTVILNSDWMGHGTDYDEAKDVIRFVVSPSDVSHEEWLRYGFESLESDAVTLYLHWERKKIRFHINLVA